MSTEAHIDDRYDYALREPRLPAPIDHSLAEAPIDLDVRLGMYRTLHRVARVREARPRPVPAGPREGHDPPRRWARKRSPRASARRCAPDDYTFCHLPRPRPHARARLVPMAAIWPSCSVARTASSAARAARCTSPSVEHGHDGLLRDRRRPPVRSRTARPGRPRCEAPTRWRSASSATAPRTSVRSTRRSTWRRSGSLPVVFVCENNLYMEYTPIDAVTAVEHPAADRAAAYGLDDDPDRRQRRRRRVPGRPDAVERARSGGGPSLIEAITYRSRRPLPGRPRQVPPDRRRSAPGPSAIRSRSTTHGCCRWGWSEERLESIQRRGRPGDRRRHRVAKAGAEPGDGVAR